MCSNALPSCGPSCCRPQIALQFSHCFWKEELDFFGAALPGDASSRGLCFMFWSLKRFCGAPVLLALVSGDAAYASEGTPAEELQAAAMRVLRKLHGDAVPEPTASDASQWLSDKSARGEVLPVCACQRLVCMTARMTTCLCQLCNTWGLSGCILDSLAGHRHCI